MSDEAPADPGGRKAARKAKKPQKATARPTREQSQIGFPYQDMEAGIVLAKAILGGGGVAVTREQLAGLMGLQANSGNFVTKVATARLFGLVANVQGKYELTSLGFAILDEKRSRQAKAEAFLTVPLYKRAYDEFRGKQLPPRPHGLEQAFVKFGVAPKQKSHARWAFDKSARQAGFFSAGEDRLIEPIMGAVSQIDTGRSQPDERDDAPDNPRRQTNDRTDEMGNFHPFIQGLIDTLPEPETNWAVEGRAKWLQAAAHIFDLIYKGSGEITIKAEPPPVKYFGKTAE
jgi:hypothetical protein